MSLRTNYKDDILNTDINVNRKFNIISSGGTVIQSDVELRETTAFTQQGDSFGAADINATNAAINALFDIFHPIGYTFAMDNLDFNPNTAKGWHGTWERITDCVIYAASDNVTGGIGAIVGSNTHTLTEAELPSHRHSTPKLTATGGKHRHSRNTGAGSYLYATTPGAGTAGGTAVSGGAGTINWNSGSYTDYADNLSFTVPASSTGNTGSGTAIDMRTRRLNSVVWRRTA